MKPITNEKLIEQLQWRYAVKKFDATKKISAEDWQTLEDSLVLTASSYGLQPWKFIIAQSKELRAQLTPASWNQSQVADCSHYVVFATKTSLDEKYIQHFIDFNAQVRGIANAKLEAYQRMMVGDLIQGPRSKMIADWAARQAYIALGNLLTSAALLGIDTCPMEGIDPIKYDQILNLTDTGYRTVVACAVGYRSNEDAYAKLAKVRFENKAVVEHR